MRCAQCDTELRAGAKFCIRCGSPARTPGAAPDESSVATTPLDTPLVVPPQAASSVRSVRKPGISAAAVVLAVLVLIAGAGLVVWMRGRNQAPTGTCETEGALKSTTGGSDGVLTVVNRRSTSVVVHWIDLAGARRRWFDIRAGASRAQRAPGNYVWVVTSPEGNCLAVASSPRTVTIE